MGGYVPPYSHGAILPKIVWGARPPTTFWDDGKQLSKILPIYGEVFNKIPGWPGPKFKIEFYFWFWPGPKVFYFKFWPGPGYFILNFCPSLALEKDFPHGKGGDRPHGEKSRQGGWSPGRKKK